MSSVNQSNDESNVVSESNSMPSIGVSSCLMGQPVRFDGNHKKNNLVTDDLKDMFNLVSICPEVAIGMGVPRQPIRLMKIEKNTVRALGVRDPALDVTDQLRNLAVDMAPTLATFSGYIFKKDSPSCGVFRVKLYGKEGMPDKSGRGIFSEQVLRGNPNMPAEEEGRLNNFELKDNFIKRVFIYHDWQSRVRQGLTCQSFEEFHRIHKFTLLAHDQACYRRLGKYVADSTNTELSKRSEYYITEFMNALKTIPTADQNINVIMHIMGFLKRNITASDKAELVRTMEKYRAGAVSKDVPLTLISHHLKNHPNQYLSSQHYLNHGMPI
jgi:uncharacterized protein YbgA (DUF1722 family)/uncharacterized protein YbbK (DUF523 family)